MDMKRYELQTRLLDGERAEMKVAVGDREIKSAEEMRSLEALDKRVLAALALAVISLLYPQLERLLGSFIKAMEKAVGEDKP